MVNNDGIIHNAIFSQSWSGEATVHVSVVNWSYQTRGDYFLDHKPVNQISSSLKSTVDITKSQKLKANKDYTFEGVKPTGKDFIVSSEQVQGWIEQDPKNQKVLKMYSTGSNLTSAIQGTPHRWIIDFHNLPLEDASKYKLPFEHIKNKVKPIREKNRDKRAKQETTLQKQQ